jgi:hypothetical protein
MSIHQNVPIYNDINTWNESTHPSAIDPNTLLATPPRTHLQHSTTETMSMWEDNPVPVEQNWGANAAPATAHDAEIAADFQAQEFTGVMNIDPDGERPPRSLRRPREYGTSHSSSLYLPSFHLFPVVSGGIYTTHLTQFWGAEPDPEPTMTADEALAALVAADQEQDLDDFKVFFLEYVRNNKTLTFVDLEKKFRDEALGVYLIAIVNSTCLRLVLMVQEKDIPQQKTIRNLQGETGKKYLVSFQLGPKNRRTRYPPPTIRI